MLRPPFRACPGRALPSSQRRLVLRWYEGFCSQLESKVKHLKQERLGAQLEGLVDFPKEMVPVEATRSRMGQGQRGPASPQQSLRVAMHSPPSSRRSLDLSVSGTPIIHPSNKMYNTLVQAVCTHTSMCFPLPPSLSSRSI